MSKTEQTKLDSEHLMDLVKVFDLLAQFDHEDKLASELKSSSPREDLSPDSNDGVRGTTSKEQLRKD